MRQFCQHRLEHDPGRDQPGQQELRTGLAPGAPHRRRGQAGQRRARPERHPEQQEIEPGGAPWDSCAPSLLSMSPPTEFGKKSLARAQEDRDEPRQHQHQAPHQPPDRAHAPEPGRAIVEERQHRHRQPDEHQDQRPLEQDAAGQRRPEDRGRRPGRMRRILAALPGKINPRQRAHRRGHGKQQHRVGFGEPRLGAEQHATRHHQRGQRAPRRVTKASAVQ